MNVTSRLVDHNVWRSHESAHHIQQHVRWEDAWRRMSEREKARALEFIYIDLLWDSLSSEEQEKAVAAVQEDRDFPTLGERLEEEARASREAEREAEAARRAEDARDYKAMGEQLARMNADLAAGRKADEERREREEREEREAEEERERQAAEQRERLQAERERLQGEPVDA